MRVVTVNRGANDSSGRIRNEASLQANKIDSVMLCIGQLSVEIWPSCHYAALNFSLWAAHSEGAVLSSHTQSQKAALVDALAPLVNIRTQITFDLKAIGGNYRETGTR